ncbi:MAG: hypothetical protein FWF59_03630, partial [Turicibacter sp.]|nr:hypothetical protein [Turicibacter sp.]
CKASHYFSCEKEYIPKLTRHTKKLLPSESENALANLTGKSMVGRNYSEINFCTDANVPFPLLSGGAFFLCSKKCS